MSLAYTPDRLTLPEKLEGQLHDFRRLVWTVKIVEAVAAAGFGILVAYLILFGLDRLWDTPGPLRAILFIAAAAACAYIPFFLHRWVWRQRQLEQLARLLSRKYPRLGRPVARHHRAGTQRIRAGEVAGLVRSRDPGRGARRRAARFQEGGSPSPASALAACSRACPWRFPCACWRSSRRPPLMPGSGSSPPGAARRATRSRRSKSCRTTWSSRMASRFHSACSSRKRRSGGRSRASPSWVARCPVTAKLVESRYHFRAAVADQPRAAPRESRRRFAGRADRADPATGAQRRSSPPSTFLPTSASASRRRRTCGVARSRSCREARRRSRPLPAAS